MCGIVLVCSEQEVFLFQEGINVAVVLVEPVLVVSVSSTEDLQGSRVNGVPKGSPLIYDVVLVGLNVLKFAVQHHLQFLRSLRASQFCCAELLGNFLSPWSSLGLDKEVQLGDDQAMIRPAFCTTHGLRQSNVIPVLSPCDDIVIEMPMPRARVHPSGLVTGCHTEHGVGDGQVMYRAQSEEEESVTVAFAHSMFFDYSIPDLVVGAKRKCSRRQSQ